MHSIKKKKKISQGLNHGQPGPINAVVITAIVNYCLTSLLNIFCDLFLLFFLCGSNQGSEGSVDAMEEKLSSGGTLIDRGIKVLRVIAGPLVKRTVSVMISV